MAKTRKYQALPEPTAFSFAAAGCSPIGNMLNPNVTATPPPAGTAFIAGPGKTLTNIHVNLIFWGGYWNNNPLAGQVEAALRNLLSGPYMTYLAQYGVHRGDVRGTTFVVDSEPGTFTFKNVTDLVVRLLDDDQLPEPDDNWPNIYAVVMPANSAVKGPAPGVLSNVNGSNGSIIWHDFEPGDVDNDPAYCLWVGNDGSPTALDYITTVLSHELAELATDPNGGDGIRQVNCSGSSCQIGDTATVCQNWCDFVRGVKAQAYWSQLDGNGVLPKMYSLKRTLFGKSIGGKIPRPMPSLNAWISRQF